MIEWKAGGAGGGGPTRRGLGLLVEVMVAQRRFGEFSIYYYLFFMSVALNSFCLILLCNEIDVPPHFLDM